MTRIESGKVLDRAAAGERHHQAAHPDVGGERDDEGVHLQLDDEEAVDARRSAPPTASAMQERDRQRQPFRRAA